MTAAMTATMTRLVTTRAAASALGLVALGALAQAPWKEVRAIGQRHFVVVDASAARNPQVLRQAATAACLPVQPCVVTFWSDAAAVPRAMPMSLAQQQAVRAQYLRNPVTGKEELLLKCLPAGPVGVKCLR